MTSDFDIEKIEKICHAIKSMDRYLAMVKTPGGMPDVKREHLNDLRAEMKKITPEDLESMSDDSKKVYERAKKILGY